MWDCADLNALCEVFHLDFGVQEWALMVGGSEGNAGQQHVHVMHAGVLPDLVRGTRKDAVREQQPLLRMLSFFFHHCCPALKMHAEGFIYCRLESANEDGQQLEAQSVFVVYLLQTHQVVKMRPLPGLSSDFIANQNFIVIVSSFLPCIGVFKILNQFGFRVPLHLQRYIFYLQHLSIHFT